MMVIVPRQFAVSVFKNAGLAIVNAHTRSGPSSIRLFASHSAAKTPVQQFGYEYLKQQLKLGRPLSPHLQIYRPQLTWLMSGANRIAGCVMSGALLVGVVVFGFLPADFTSFMDRVHSWELWRPVAASFKFLIAFPIVFHMLNSIRFMGFDMALGMDLTSIYRSGYLVLALSSLISLLIVLNSQRLTRDQFRGKFNIGAVAAK